MTVDIKVDRSVIIAKNKKIIKTTDIFKNI